MPSTDGSPNTWSFGLLLETKTRQLFNQFIYIGQIVNLGKILKMTPSVYQDIPSDIGHKNSVVVAKAPEPLTPPSTPILSRSSISNEFSVLEIQQKQNQLIKAKVTASTNVNSDCTYYKNFCDNYSESNICDLTKPSYDERDNKTNIGNGEICMRIESQYRTINEIYNREDERRKTFLNWPLNSLDQNELAMLGMFYTGDEDKVKCYFCEVEIGRWESEDQPLHEHMRWSPNCPLLRRRTTNNVPIDSEALNNFLPPISYDTCGSNFEPDTDTARSLIVYNNNVTAVSNGGASAVNTAPTGIGYSPEYPEYSIEAARFRSYTDWPVYMKQKPAELAEAGFFYTGIGDRVKCFSCGGGLKDWSELDEPWEQHALWMPACRYLKIMKGKAYIDDVKVRHSNQAKYGSDFAEPIIHDDSSASTSTYASSGESTKLAACRAQTICTSATAPANHVTNPYVASVDRLHNNKKQNSLKIALAGTMAETEATKSDLTTTQNEKLSTLNCPINDELAAGSTQASEKKPSGGFFEEKICKICYASEYNTCFLPCSHVVACAKCASSVSTCPVCRVPIQDVVRLYFS